MFLDDFDVHDDAEYGVHVMDIPWNPHGLTWN